MAIGAAKGGGLVEQYVFPIHFFLLFVTVAARDAFMSALEGELRLLVIKERGLPLVAVVALGAIALLVGELLAVGIFVAFAASLGSLAEIHVEQGALHIRRLVTIGAFHGTMRADEREFRGGVIELCHVAPLLR